MYRIIQYNRGAALRYTRVTQTSLEQRTLLKSTFVLTGERRLLGGLRDDSAAGCESGGHFEEEQAGREVPGNDGAHDAHRLRTRVAELRRVGGHHIARYFVHPPGVISHTCRSEVEVASRRRDRLAVVECLDPL